METLYFVDNGRTAARHLLDSQFGARLKEFGDFTGAEDDSTGWMEITLPVDPDGLLSGGERVLLAVLRSLSQSGGPVNLGDFYRLDDANWDRVIRALFMERGRALVSA